MPDPRKIRLFQERLRKLATILENPTPETPQLKMWTWYSRSDCGTTACAAGTAACHPWFRRRGFRMSVNDFGWSGIPEYTDRDGFKSVGFNACQHFFGVIDPFNPRTYHSAFPRPSTVARRLREAANEMG